MAIDLLSPPTTMGISNVNNRGVQPQPGIFGRIGFLSSSVDWRRKSGSRLFCSLSPPPASIGSDINRKVLSPLAEHLESIGSGLVMDIPRDAKFSLDGKIFSEEELVADCKQRAARWIDSFKEISDICEENGIDLVKEMKEYKYNTRLGYNGSDSFMLKADKSDDSLEIDSTKISKEIIQKTPSSRRLMSQYKAQPVSLIPSLFICCKDELWIHSLSKVGLDSNLIVYLCQGAAEPNMYAKMCMIINYPLEFVLAESVMMEVAYVILKGRTPVEGINACEGYNETKQIRLKILQKWWRTLSTFYYCQGEEGPASFKNAFRLCSSHLINVYDARNLCELCGTTNVFFSEDLQHKQSFPVVRSNIERRVLAWQILQYGCKFY